MGGCCREQGVGLLLFACFPLLPQLVKSMNVLCGSWKVVLVILSSSRLQTPLPWHELSSEEQGAWCACSSADTGSSPPQPLCPIAGGCSCVQVEGREEGLSWRDGCHLPSSALPMHHPQENEICGGARSAAMATTLAEQVAKGIITGTRDMAATARARPTRSCLTPARPALGLRGWVGQEQVGRVLCILNLQWALSQRDLGARQLPQSLLFIISPDQGWLIRIQLRVVQQGLALTSRLYNTVCSGRRWRPSARGRGPGQLTKAAGLRCDSTGGSDRTSL